MSEILVGKKILPTYIGVLSGRLCPPNPSTYEFSGYISCFGPVDMPCRYQFLVILQAKENSNEQKAQCADTAHVHLAAQP